MKNKQKFEINEKVLIKTTGETVTIKNCNYVDNMKRYAYILKEYPSTFYFEEELTVI